MQKPSLCRWVLTPVEKSYNNGAEVAPALITRVWGDDMVNLTVFGDYNSPTFKSSAKLFATEEEMWAWVKENTPEDHEMATNPLACYWPPKVT